MCFCFVFLRLVYPMLPVSLDCRILIAPSVFSNLYWLHSLKSDENNIYLLFPFTDISQHGEKRVKHNIGSICRNLLLCDVILHLLLFYKSKSHILSIVNVCSSFSQNFDTVPQMVSEIWLKTYTKNGSFSMLCCCT